MKSLASCIASWRLISFIVAISLAPSYHLSMAGKSKLAIQQPYHINDYLYVLCHRIINGSGK